MVLSFDESTIKLLKELKEKNRQANIPNFGADFPTEPIFERVG